MKRVSGEPAKTHYQDHNKHLMKLYRGSRRFRFKKIIESLSVQDLALDQMSGSRDATLSLESQLAAFDKKWQTSDHEPLRVVVLYLKDSA